MSHTQTLIRMSAGALVILTLALPAYAQTGNMQNRKGNSNGLQNLTPQQIAQLQTLMHQMQAILQQGANGQQNFQLAQNGNMQNRKGKANGLQNLTPQQIAQLQTLMQQMQAILQQGANGQQNFQQRGNQNFNAFQQQGNAAIQGNGNAPAAGFRPTGLQRK
jgi:DNA-binding PadR family transcriptional regulator